ncbi:MAG: DMT family transporter [Pseudomonadota bacterium]
MQDRQGRAVLAVLGAGLCLSFGDAVVKLTSSGFSLWQVFTLRSGLAVLALGAFVVVARVSIKLGPSLMRWGVARSVLLVIMWLLYYAALPHMEFALAAAIYYAAPIFMALMSVVFLGDRMTALGWGAVALGFAGVLLILKPAGDIDPVVLLPVLSAGCYAAAMVLTRVKCRDETPLTLAFLLHATFVLAGIIGTLASPLLGLDGYLGPHWAAMSAQAWLAMGVLAAAALVGSIFAAIAYQNASPALVGTADYSYVIFAVVWGALLFSEIPDAVSAVGIGCIVIAGAAMAMRGLR